MTAPAPAPVRQDAVHRYRRALVGPVLVVPVVVAAAGAAVLLAALPALPDRVLVHWGVEGTTSGSPLTALVAVPTTAAIAVVLWLALRRPENVRMGLQGRLVAALPVWVACFVTIGLVGTVVLQARPGAPVPWLPLVLGAGVGLLAGLVVARTVPVPPRGAAPSRVAPLPVRPDERLAWFGTAAASPGVQAGALGVLVVAAGAVLLAGLATVPAVALVAVVPLACAVLAATMLTWRVRIDRAGVTAVGALGFPRLHVPADDVAAAAVTTVAPIGDLGGFGLRQRPGVTAVATRGGEAVEVTRRDGRRLLLTVDDAADAAGVLEALRR
jgi:hypothetical protein